MKRPYPGRGFLDRPPLKRVVEILVYEDHGPPPICCVVLTALQLSLDGVHLKVVILHQLQSSCHEAQQAQEEESWFVAPHFGEGFDEG